MLPKNVYNQVSDTATDVLSAVVSNMSGVATSVSGNVEEVVSSLSSNVGETLHNISSGMKRMVTSPPDEEDIEKELEFTRSSSPMLTTPDDGHIQQGIMTDYLHQPDLASLDSGLLEQNLGMLEDHFSEPQIFEIGNDASKEDIENAITKTKDFILNCEESSQKRRIYVQRLIQLRLMLERAKEEKDVEKEGIQVRQGHQLSPVLSKLTSPRKQFCDRCSQVIWAVIHVSYKCSLCDYLCHGKCVKSNHPKCPSEKFYDTPTYILDICPEVGLDAQDFRCFQCKTLITGKTAWGEPRLCDYYGRFYCPTCHWNARMPIPARIIHNWNFEEQLVSQPAKHFLSFVRNKPLIALEELNPSLPKFLSELHEIKKLRQELIVMKDYFSSCRVAQKSRLLLQLSPRPHIASDDLLFSVQDLIDIKNNVLVPFLKSVHGNFVSHIKNTCETCQGKGFICELCESKEVIFPFDDYVYICNICKAVFHDKCFSRASECPRCIRQCSRRLKKQEIRT